jgi:enamine deaminase RidA (YjgF/YER057c/UK114 family)
MNRTSMNLSVKQLPGAAPPVGYAPAIHVSGGARLLFLSGQVPVAADGSVPLGIEAQARQVWANIASLLAEAGMSTANLVKVTVFLSDGALRPAANAVADEIMDGHLVAWTTVVAGIIRPEWLLEIEAIAVG